jgi:uncharacterized protein (TIGR02996 family)
MPANLRTPQAGRLRLRETVPMTDREALLQAILENPDDDAPRLVYADWLDEHGDADRAEFIRVQCELARGASTPRRSEVLTDRARQLQSAHGSRWERDLPGQPAIAWLDRYDRGFLYQAAARRWTDLSSVWDQAFSNTPLVFLIVVFQSPTELDHFLGRFPVTAPSESVPEHQRPAGCRGTENQRVGLSREMVGSRIGVTDR